MRWRYWRQKLESNTLRPIPRTDPPQGLTLQQRQLLLRSLCRFQLGESGEGRVAHEIDSVTWPGVDDDLRALVKLWVREEGRHARILGQMVQGMGGSVIRRHWSAGAFQVARRALGVRWKLLIALAAEVVGLVFYGLLSGALPECGVGEALSQLEGDEGAHLQFQAELFGMLSRSALSSFLIQLGWHVCGAAACVLVWAEHARTLRALGVPSARTARALWHHYRDVSHRISQARRQALAAVPAVA